MHLIKDTEVRHRYLNYNEKYECHQTIDWYIKSTLWVVSRRLIVLPPDFTPDFFLGLCIVEGIKVPEGLKICSSDDYYKTIDKDHSIDSVFTLAVKI